MIVEFGPMMQSVPITLFPSIIEPDRIVVPAPIVTLKSIWVVIGCSIITPCLIRSNWIRFCALTRALE